MCKSELDISNFSKQSKNKDGLECNCKTCKSTIAKEYYDKNKSEVKRKVKEYRSNNIEVVNNRVKSHYEKNKESILEYKKEYYSKNKEKENKRNMEYYRLNRESIRVYMRNYIKNRRKNDVLFKLKDTISRLIHNSIKNRGVKKSLRTEQILGCTIKYFLSHIESLFKDDMTWENQGTWHLDHITPISWAVTEDDVYKLNHFSNFQPLWASENLKKKNRYSG